jgi:dolichyl-phosphate beta-glucosyltransferase
MNNVNLSIIIPAYNEEKRLSLSLDKINRYFNTNDLEYEVIVVDDGSTDRTVNFAHESDLARCGKLSIISNGRNRGKGFSVKAGILASRGEYVLFTDADLSTSITEFDKLWSLINEGYDVVMASRSIEGSVLKVRQPWYRQTMGRVFNLFVKALLFADHNDTQCGFKLFRGGPAREIAEKMKVNGFCFDVEMIYLAKKAGYRIKETGVVWENSIESKVDVVRGSASMFTDLLKIKKWHK